jgi:hypothetical protein
MRLYVLVVQRGRIPEVMGPYTNDDVAGVAAGNVKARLKKKDRVFWLSVEDSGEATVGPWEFYSPKMPNKKPDKAIIPAQDIG